MKFYKGTNSITEIYWADKGQHYRNNFNDNKEEYRKLEHILFAGVKQTTTESIKYLTTVNVSEEFIEKYKLLEEKKPIAMTLNKLQKVSLKVLNHSPYLQGFTCMGWDDNKTVNDPNYYSGNYIFPDGNLYTIVKQKNRVEVYPGKGEYCFMMNDKQLPLVKYKIDVEKWAERMDNPKSKVKITKLK